jgi:hypothetical protein
VYVSPDRGTISCLFGCHTRVRRGVGYAVQWFRRTVLYCFLTVALGVWSSQGNAAAGVMAHLPIYRPLFFTHHTRKRRQIGNDKSKGNRVWCVHDWKYLAEKKKKNKRKIIRIIQHRGWFFFYCTCTYMYNSVLGT